MAGRAREPTPANEPGPAADAVYRRVTGTGADRKSPQGLRCLHRRRVSRLHRSHGTIQGAGGSDNAGSAMDQVPEAEGFIFALQVGCFMA